MTIKLYKQIYQGKCKSKKLKINNDFNSNT